MAEDERIEGRGNGFKFAHFIIFYLAVFAAYGTSFRFQVYWFGGRIKVRRF